MEKKLVYRYAALFLFIASVFALFVIMKHEFTGYVVFEQGREISERGSSWNRYENNDGTKTLEISDVINYFEGNYKPIAISLRQGCGDYDYCQDKGAYQAYFKANSTGTDIVKYSYNNYEASYTPFSLEYVYETLRLKEELGILSKNNLPIPKQNLGANPDFSFVFRIRVDNLDIENHK